MSDQNDKPLAKSTFLGDGCQMDTDESREDRIEGVQKARAKVTRSLLLCPNMQVQTNICPGIFGHSISLFVTVNWALLPTCCPTSVDCFPIGQVLVCNGMLGRRIL